MAGAVLRLYLGKAFAMLGVTASDSALFIDLPANMLGSFIVGLLCDGKMLRLHGGADHRAAIVPPGHRMQGHARFWAALRTGFCGSLTTFASWNTQMVVMLSTEKHGIARAVCGWIIGTELASASYSIGHHTALALAKWAGHRRAWKPPSVVQMDKEEGCEGDEIQHDYIVDEAVVLVTFVALWTVAMAGAVMDWANDRVLWVGLVSAPFGVHLRSQLGRMLNPRLPGPHVWGVLSDREDDDDGRSWFPWGTFAANVLASVFDACASAALLCPSSAATAESLNGLELGFAGALSTVSTWVLEFHTLSQMRHGTRARARAYAYLFATVAATGVVCTAVFAGTRRGVADWGCL